ncbi:hypothetical protein VaNZ11_016751 [Volvox africanus]|uniref:Copper transporter n=1 Tax=Volvox africanus TaxID=51714 RepID=A0ABQ5SPS1_9CHLO|nr:hypothetical protein VaNZ11_016751 [Volvox africanus]
MLDTCYAGYSVLLSLFIWAEVAALLLLYWAALPFILGIGFGFLCFDLAARFVSDRLRTLRSVRTFACCEKHTQSEQDAPTYHDNILYDLADADSTQICGGRGRMLSGYEVRCNELYQPVCGEFQRPLNRLPFLNSTSAAISSTGASAAPPLIPSFEAGPRSRTVVRITPTASPPKGPRTALHVVSATVGYHSSVGHSHRCGAPTASGSSDISVSNPSLRTRRYQTNSNICSEVVVASKNITTERSTPRYMRGTAASKAKVASQGGRDRHRVGCSAKLRPTLSYSVVDKRVAAGTILRKSGPY